MTADDPRIRYAIEVLGELFPQTSVTPGHSRSVTATTRSFALSPSGRRPRLLVPTEPRGAAASALRGYGGRLTRQARWGYAGAAHALAICGPALLRDRLQVSALGDEPVAGIDDHLSHVLGRDVSVAVHLTPSRANRKPIVQALADGERHPLAFAKVAVDPLTSRLVERESHALTAIAARSLTGVVAPTVADDGTFAGHRVLTLHPLPTWLPGRSPTIAEVTAAAAEVASLTEATRGPLQDSRYWRGVQQQSAALPATPRAELLRRCVARTATQLGQTDVTFGASHGDWSPWNMWLTNRGLLVWDWERFERETPHGFDLLHFRLNDQLIRRRWSEAQAGHLLVAEAPQLLADVVTADPPQHTVLLYLLSLGLRYEADGQAAAGAALGQLEAWLLPALEAGLADPNLAERT